MEFFVTFVLSTVFVKIVIDRSQTWLSRVVKLVVCNFCWSFMLSSLCMSNSCIHHFVFNKEHNTQLILRANSIFFGMLFNRKVSVSVLWTFVGVTSKFQYCFKVLYSIVRLVSIRCIHCHIGRWWTKNLQSKKLPIILSEPFSFSDFFLSTKPPWHDRHRVIILVKWPVVL